MSNWQKPMSKEEIEKAAREVHSWLDSAYSDAAMGEVYMETGSQDYADAEIRADQMTTEVDTICDLTGDRIHDEGRGNYDNMIAIAEEFKLISSNPSERTAMDDHIKRWKGYKEA